MTQLSSLKTRQLHAHFGVEIEDVNLAEIQPDGEFAAIRAAFDEHSLLLFRNQTLDEQDLLRLAAMFGPIENRTKGPIHVPTLTNKSADGSVFDESSRRVLNLKANQLWHTDSTFLPVPALANIITARIVPSSGGETELVSTRKALEDMPKALKDAIANKAVWHRYAHSRAKISPDLAREELFTMWKDQIWKSVWRNPANGRDALYLASHAFRIEDMDEVEGQKLIEQAIDFCTMPERIYCHKWQVGDVLIWDERATLHRGRPWPYEQERTLNSVCVSATASDGLDQMRPAGFTDY